MANELDELNTSLRSKLDELDQLKRKSKDLEAEVTEMKGRENSMVLQIERLTKDNADLNQ